MPDMFPTWKNSHNCSTDFLAFAFLALFIALDDGCLQPSSFSEQKKKSSERVQARRNQIKSDGAFSPKIEDRASRQK